MDLRLKHSFTCMVSGPTGSGKTVLVKALIKHMNELIVPVPQIIYWCYTEYQDSYFELESMPNVRLCEGLPDLALLKAGKQKPQLLILDDLMADCKKNDKLTQLFVKGSHHWNLSVIHIVQNAFFEGLRSARINAHYLFLMKSPSDQLQIQTLARQLFPRNQNYMIESYQDATSRAHGYLLVDMNQYTPDNLRLRTNILPGQLQIVYVAK
jgi:hypothetical protein